MGDFSKLKHIGDITTSQIDRLISAVLAFVRLWSFQRSEGPLQPAPSAIRAAHTRHPASHVCIFQWKGQQSRVLGLYLAVFDLTLER